MLIGKEIRVFTPATISNIGCGFDIMGFAIDQPGDELTLKIVDKPGVTISKIIGDSGKLPYDPEKNTVTVAINAMLRAIDLRIGVEVEIHKGIPVGGGLGSSAASSVAGVFALNQLLNKPLPIEQILNFALQGEAIASLAIHADNVAPCLYGGFVLIRGYDPVDVIKIAVPENLYCSVIHSQVAIKTAQARAILPKQIPFSKAITQWGNVGGLVAGLLQNDFALISRSLQDVIVEPVRAKLIPHYAEIKAAALAAGAIGCNISGSGPAIFALSDNKATADKIAINMQQVANQANLKNTVYVSKINQTGPKII